MTIQLVLEFEVKDPENTGKVDADLITNMVERSLWRTKEQFFPHGLQLEGRIKSEPVLVK